jgi:hypothetical protein
VRSKTYANKTPEAAYASTIKPQCTEALEVLFRLDEDVKKTSREPTESLVYYRIGEKQQIARATATGG